MTGPRDLPETRKRRVPYDDSDDGVAGYLPETRDRLAFYRDEDERENEDEAEL
jgi:hypothetical protein